MAISEWAVLKCDCRSDLFMPLVRLKFKPEGGTTTEPAGHKCSACGAVVDNRYMIQLIEIQKKREEITRLQADVAVTEAGMKKGAAPAGRS